MDNQEKLNFPWVKDLLSQPILARLATANPRTCQPHVVPVWFAWNGDQLFISAFSSTRKVKDILKNRRIAVLIDIDKDNPPTRGILLEGIAELIREPAQVQQWSTLIYTHYMGEDGVKAPEPQSWIVDPENTIIALLPERVFTWGGSD